MLAYTLNNNPLALNIDTSVRLTWYNPACFFDRIPGDLGMGIDIPFNDINRTFLGNPERFEKMANEGDREFPKFEVRYSGFLLLSGTLIIQKATREQYSGWLRSNVGNLGKLHREKYIYDIAAFNRNITFQNKANYIPGTDHYACPKIFNPEFFYDKGRKITLYRKVENPEYVDLSWWQELFANEKPAYIDEPYETEALTEAFRVTSNWTVNALNPDNTVKLAVDSSPVNKLETNLRVSVVSPMLFLDYILKTILQDASFYIDQNFITTDPDLSKLILYSNYDITNIFLDHYSNVNWENLQWNDNMTLFASVRLLESITRNYIAPFQYKNLIPKIKLADFLLSVQNQLNVVFHFKNDNKVNIIDRESILSNPAIDIDRFRIGAWEIWEKKNLCLKFSFEHDKNDTLFSERWEDVDDRRIDENGALENWTDIEAIENPALGEIRYIKSHNLYVEYAWVQKVTIDPNSGKEVQTDAMGWKHLALGYQNGYHQFGRDNQEEIKSKFSTLFGQQTVSTHQRGNVNSLKYAYQNFTPRLLFYHGNNRASYETENLSLDWEKINTGLIAKRYPGWKNFWSTRQSVIGQMNFPINAIAHTVQHITEKFRTKEGEFIIEKMETTFGLNSIGVTNIEAFKI